MTSAIDTPTSTVEPTTAVPPVPGGAVAAVAGALVLVVCNVLSGLYPHTDSTKDFIAAMGANAGLYELTAATGLLAAVLLVPGIWVVVHRLRGRSPALAIIGGWLMATGYLMSTVLSFETLTMLSALAAGADPAVLAEASDNQARLTAVVVYYVFGLGALIGTLVLGIAMLRQKGGVPTWAGWAMIASAPVRMIGLFTGLTFIGPPLASLLIAAAFVGVLFARRS